MSTLQLPWLPVWPDWDGELSIARKLSPEESASRLLKLAEAPLDLVQTTKLDRSLQAVREAVRGLLPESRPLRLAVIGSSTLNHLLPGIRVGSVRRGLWVEVFQGNYGSYHQELANPESDLYSFRPDVVLIALDAHHVVSREQHQPGQTIEALQSCWRLAKDNLGAAVIQQTVLPVFGPVLGNNEHHHPSSAHSIIARLNQELRSAARAQSVALLAIDTLSHQDGIAAWYEPASWHRYKQEVHPRASVLYGDHVARLLAALRGRTHKCLVLDLDNTLWGGVIGDDGLDGIQLGQGNAVGEAFVSFQRYLKEMSHRGILLAVCSKNDLNNAELPFREHPEMVLRKTEIAAFVANWDDKATNLRRIAKQLNIGLDALVFVDDNPFERNLVRRELPMVAVPEMPEDAALYGSLLAEAGYCEAIHLTAEDQERTRLYTENTKREEFKASATDLNSYLHSLNMQLLWSSFDAHSVSRIVQLINRSNQFNLTTRRYTSEQVTAIMDNADYLTLQLRLRDAFGDNGLIAVLIGKTIVGHTMEIDTWLMSCRVLGRQVEEATLNLLVEQAHTRGITRLIGRYLPTTKNEMVRQLYQRLGFQPASVRNTSESVWHLSLADYKPKQSLAKPVFSGLRNIEENKEESHDPGSIHLCEAHTGVS